MLKFLKWFFGFFSPYVNSSERKVDRFFSHIKSTDNVAKVREKLLELMQSNLIVVNIWLEKKFKGYSYLNKRVRRKMYSDVEKIKTAFEKFRQNNSIDVKKLRKLMEAQGLQFPVGDEQKIVYLAEIMAFLRPGKYYHYIKTSSFGKLLRDPEKQKLEGDCNQIVTLYIYLYSLRFPIGDLKIKLLPEHVCLHFREVDMEATSGEFAKYRKYDELLPVTEIVSTNLLDLSDFREDVQQISERTILKSAQLAYAISSLKSLVEKNLHAAYHNLGVAALHANDFNTAIFYLEKAGEEKVLASAYHNAALYYLKQGNFGKASFYAERSRKQELIDSVEQAKLAECYNKLVARVSGVKTLQDARKYRSVYREMLSVAEKLKNEKLAQNLRETLKKL